MAAQDKTLIPGHTRKQAWIIWKVFIDVPVHSIIIEFILQIFLFWNFSRKIVDNCYFNLIMLFCRS